VIAETGFKEGVGELVAGIESGQDLPIGIAGFPVQALRIEAFSDPVLGLVGQAVVRKLI